MVGKRVIINIYATFLQYFISISLLSSGKEILEH